WPRIQGRTVELMASLQEQHLLSARRAAAVLRRPPQSHELVRRMCIGLAGPPRRSCEVAEPSPPARGRKAFCLPRTPIDDTPGIVYRKTPAGFRQGAKEQGSPRSQTQQDLLDASSFSTKAEAISISDCHIGQHERPGHTV